MTAQPILTDLDDDVSMQKHVFTESANWVIPSVLMAGMNPVLAKEGKQLFIEKLINEAKITTFVNLQSEATPPAISQDLGGIRNDGREQEGKMLSYEDDVASANPAVDPQYVYYGMVDEEVADSMENLQMVVSTLAKRIEEGEVLYVHCKGGSGRTGTIIACLLLKLYPELTADLALERTQRYFEMRAKGAGKWVNPKLKSPATDEQRKQVKEFASYIISEIIDVVESTATPQNQFADRCSIM